MATKTIIKPAGAPAAVGPYNQAVRIGDLLYCSGQIPINPADPKAPLPEDIKAQTLQVIQNIKAILQDQGLTTENVVKTTVFMVNLAQFADMNSIYAEHFGPNYPARSTIQVAALPLGASVEIEIVAHY
jgi:2-iminobutanoate/2-iminopropanoate deaminase